MCDVDLTDRFGALSLTITGAKQAVEVRNGSDLAIVRIPGDGTVIVTAHGTPFATFDFGAKPRPKVTIDLNNVPRVDMSLLKRAAAGGDPAPPAKKTKPDAAAEPAAAEPDVPEVVKPKRIRKKKPAAAAAAAAAAAEPEAAEPVSIEEPAPEPHAAAKPAKQATEEQRDRKRERDRLRRQKQKAKTQADAASAGEVFLA